MLTKVLGFFILALLIIPASGEARIRGTAHDFPSRMPDLIVLEKVKLCRYCHQAHKPGPKDLPSPVYRVYLSSSLRIIPNQPDGSSRQCLFCHDGTKDLTSLWSDFVRGSLTSAPIKGRVSIGTDLSDDHPVSFKYDRNLILRKPHLVTPESLPPQVKLDGNGKVQCTSCHDPHQDRFGKFLVMGNSFSQLCISCHRFRGASPPHSSSQTSCQDCHAVHGASQPQWLLNLKAWERRIPH